MKQTRFTESQIVNILKEAENGIAVADILRNHGISKSTFLSGDQSMVALRRLNSNA